MPNSFLMQFIYLLLCVTFIYIFVHFFCICTGLIEINVIIHNVSFLTF